MRVRAAFLAALALGLLYMSDACAATKPLHWIINGPALQYYIQDASARAYFEGAQPFVIRRKTDTLTLPPSWNAREVRSFTSERAIERAFATGAIDSHVRAILYDNEAWSFTPLEEQRDSAGYTRKAASVVHAHGLQLIAAPSVNLLRTLDPGYTGKKFQRFLELGVLGGAAKSADVVVIQAQGAETALPLYSGFVRDGAGQARAANPHVLVLAGVSTNPSGQAVTADQVLAAIEQTKGAVDGYWMNVPSPGAYCPGCTEFRPDMAIQVLKKLSQGRLP